MKISSVASVVLAGREVVFTGCGGGEGSSSTSSNYKTAKITVSDANVIYLSKISPAI
jgi:hypothetical protein